jgi:hypothetical protein
MLGTLLYIYSVPNSFTPRTNFPTYLLMIAGFLVGFGTRLGNGCTSGHAICGIAQLSPRSIVATCVFMFSAAVTVYMIRHVLELTP